VPAYLGDIAYFNTFKIHVLTISDLQLTGRKNLLFIKGPLSCQRSAAEARLGVF